MNMRSKIWKFATTIMVFLIMLNPEMINFALFIDAIGLEIFFLLVEAQAVIILAALSGVRIRPVLDYIKSGISYHLVFSWKNVSQTSGRLMLVLPDQATIMHMLVFSAAIGAALNVS